MIFGYSQRHSSRRSSRPTLIAIPSNGSSNCTSHLRLPHDLDDLILTAVRGVLSDPRQAVLAGRVAERLLAEMLAFPAQIEIALDVEIDHPHTAHLPPAQR